MRNLFVTLLFFVLAFSANTQPARQLVQVIVTPDKADWTYERGEQAKFTISVLRNNVPLNDVKVDYRVNPEKMDPLKEGSVTLKNGEAVIQVAPFNDAGFLNCHASVVVDGHREAAGDRERASVRRSMAASAMGGTSEGDDGTTVAWRRGSPHRHPARSARARSARRHG